MSETYEARIEALRKAQRTGLQLVDGDDQGEPRANDLAISQVEAAIGRGQQDLSGAPRWRWAALDHLTGPMLPGDLVVVGALTSNGKTAYLLSQLDAFATDRVPVLYLPLEVYPIDVRRRWAAWSLGYDPLPVARNDWHELPDGAQARHEAAMVQLAANGLVQFPPDRRVNLAGLGKWIRWAVDEIGVRIVMIDHLHRLDFGGASANYRVAVTETVRHLKDLAREHQLVILAAAQLNQASDNPLDRYFPPTLRRLKESSGISEEADVVLMLSRRLRGQLTKENLADIRAGLRSERDFAEPETMAVTCRKHRLADALAGDRTVLLRVRAGRVEDRP